MIALQKGSRIVATASALAALAAAVAVIAFFSFFVFGGPLSRLSRVAVREGRLPVTITVFGRSVDTVSARVSFYRTNGELAGMVERSWAGWELRVDSILVSTGSGWLVFPFRVYTDETAANRGVDLIRQYDRGGIPVLYDSPTLDARERSALSRVFALVKTERWMPSFLGKLLRRTVTIRSFESGLEYHLSVSKDGTLSLSAN